MTEVGGFEREIRPGGTGAANFRAKYGLVYAEATTTKGLPKDPAARARFLNALRDHNRQLAKDLQDLTAKKLEQNRLQSRRGVATGRLKASILSNRNRFANAFAFGVGVMDYLDHSSPAKHYWRQIEVGTDVHVGREIAGIWGNSLTGLYSGRTGQYGEWPLAGPAFSPHGADSDGRLRPMGRKKAYAFLRSQGMRAAAASKATRSITTEIGQPIEAEEYYHDAWEEFDARDRGTEALIAALREANILPGR